MKIKKRYFVLGKKASIFYDPSTRLKVTSSDKSKPAELEMLVSKRVKLALDKGHIIEIEGPQKGDTKDDEKEGNVKEITAEALKSASNEDLEKAHTKKEFLEFYKENYEVNEDDEKAFMKKTKEDMIVFLKEGEEE